MSENRESRTGEPSTENREPISSYEFLRVPSVPASSCHLAADEAGHCITCSDEALECMVVRVDSETQMAVVAVQGAQEEIDISLIDDVAPGDTVLAHGGVAISKV